MEFAWIGWVSSLVVTVTLVKQLFDQWKAGSAKGVSLFLFLGQSVADIGFITYSCLLHNWVFIVTNSILLFINLVGFAFTLMQKREAQGKTSTESKRLCEYDIFMPVTGEEKDLFERRKFRDKIVEIFGGITESRHRDYGEWKVGPLRVKDEITKWTVLNDKGKAGEQKMAKLKSEMAETFNQDQLLVLRREVVQI